MKKKQKSFYINKKKLKDRKRRMIKNHRKLINKVNKNHHLKKITLKICKCFKNRRKK